MQFWQDCAELQSAGPRSGLRACHNIRNISVSHWPTQTTSRKMSDAGKSPDANLGDYDAIVIGAGFAGLYAVFKLAELGGNEV
jgi:ribulose 1,5-bisphosphate synthetase/thiazole synthase